MCVEVGQLCAKTELRITLPKVEGYIRRTSRIRNILVGTKSRPEFEFFFLFIYVYKGVYNYFWMYAAANATMCKACILSGCIYETVDREAKPL